MKKTLLIILISFFYSQSIAYNIPFQSFQNKTLEVQYNKLEKNLNKYYENKINNLNIEDKNNFEVKIEVIKNLFKKIDDEILAGNKKEAGYKITELKKEIVYLVYFLKKASIETKNESDKQIVFSVSNSQTTNVSLNNFASNSISADATYYADYFEGQNTSNGNIFSQNYFSSAKCNIALNTLIQINKDGKSVITKINDRPNCLLYPDLIDMSTISFDFLAKRYIGKQKVEFIPLGIASKDYYKSYIANNFFENIGIILDGKIPNSYLTNESFYINGSVEPENRSISLQIISPSGKEIILTKQVEKYFSFSYSLEETGTYKINFLGNEKSLNIYVLEDKIFNGKKFETGNSQKLNSLEIIKDSLGEGINGYRLIQKNSNYNIIKLTQDGKNYFFSGIGDIIIPENITNNLDFSREIQAELKTTKTITGFSHDFYIDPIVIFSGSIIISK